MKGRKVATPGVVALVAAMQGFGQADKPFPNPEVRGIVVDGGTGRGLAGVQVSLDFGTLPKNEYGVAGAITDANGQFIIPATDPDNVPHDGDGGYSISAYKEGYLPSDVGLPLDGTELHLKTKLLRLGEIKFRVVDEAGIPLPNFSVSLGVFYYANGTLKLRPYGVVQTENTGRPKPFALIPDMYAVMTPPSTGGEAIVTSFSPDDLRTVDMAYQRAYWPGHKTTLDTAVPIKLGSGEIRDFGDLKLAKAPYYRVHVILSGIECNGDVQSVEFHLFPTSEMRPIGAGPCRKEVLIRNLPAGTFALRVVTKGSEGRKTATVPFEVTDHNFDLTVAPTAGLNLIIRYTGATDRFPCCDSVRMMPVGGDSMDGQLERRSQFEYVMGDLEPVPHHVFAGSYVKEIRYNGALVVDDVIPLDVAAADYVLEVALGAEDGKIEGTVMDGDRVLKLAHLV